MAPPSAKKIRTNRTHSPATAGTTTRPLPAAVAAAFQTLTNQRKNNGYYHLNQEMVVVLKAAQQIGNPSSEDDAATRPLAQSQSTEDLRKYFYEYLRIAYSIDLAYDITAHYCGKVIVMGNNENSQLMPVSTIEDNANNSNVPPTVNSLVKSEIRAVAAGGLHTMALSTKGIPFTWGVNDKGALGRIVRDGTNNNVGDVEEGAPGAVTGFTTTYQSQYHNDIGEDGMIHQIAAGENHSLFLSIHGNVYMCGGYLDAEAHDFSDDDSRKVVDTATKKAKAVIGFNRKPVHVYQLPRKAVAIAAGSAYNAALLDDDTVVTWGMNDLGALARTVNGEFGGDASFMETVTTGDKSYQVPKTNGIIEKHYLQPKPVVFAHNPSISPKVIAIACGLRHLLVVARDPDSLHGNLYSSGMNNWGQLGHGDQVNRNTLTLVQATEDENFVQVAAGEFHSMALTHDRSALYCFGRGDSGQLGIGVRAAIAKDDFWFSTPQLLKFEKEVEIASIDAGGVHSSAITIDGELYTWGFNEEGATGHKTESIDPTRPTLLKLHMEPDRLPVQFSGGGQHSVLLVGPRLTE